MYKRTIQARTFVGFTSNTKLEVDIPAMHISANLLYSTSFRQTGSRRIRKNEKNTKSKLHTMIIIIFPAILAFWLLTLNYTALHIRCMIKYPVTKPPITWKQNETALVEIQLLSCHHCDERIVITPKVDQFFQLKATIRQRLSVQQKLFTFW